MKVYYGIDKLNPLHNAVVTSGTFDGVHLGHKIILSRLKEIANESRGESVVITYWPHPRYVLGQKSPTQLKLLTSLEEKIELLEKESIDILLVLPFTKEFSSQSSQEFINNILVKAINTKKLVIGYDHKFGKNREGSFEYLKDHQNLFNFSIEEIPRQDVDNVGISSTKIREALSAGEVAKAFKFLGRHYSIKGKVVIGDQLGRKIGFPTANISVDEENKLIPSDGVYAVMVHVRNRTYKGMMNIGIRPTVNGSKKSIEAHIFQFDEDIYGLDISVGFVEHIREEKKFSNVNELKAQLFIDKEKVKKILDENIGN